MKVKAIVAIAIIAASSTVYAAQKQTNKTNTIKKPFYISISTGYARSYYNNSYLRNAKSVANIDKTGLATRLSAGYQLNKMLSVELSMTQLQNVKFNDVKYENSSVTASYKSRAFDLSAKVYKKLNKFNVYAQAGAALLHRYDSKMSINHHSVKSTISLKNRIIPVLGAGVDYKLTSKVSATLSDTIYVGRHKLANTNLVLAGLRYSFS